MPGRRANWDHLDYCIGRKVYDRYDLLVMMHHKEPGSINRDIAFLRICVTGIVAVTTRFTVSITLTDVLA